MSAAQKVSSSKHFFSLAMFAYFPVECGQKKKNLEDQLPDDMKPISVKDAVSAEEWKARVDCAMLYRLVAMHGWPGCGRL